MSPLSDTLYFSQETHDVWPPRSVISSATDGHCFGEWLSISPESLGEMTTVELFPEFLTQ
jgi:hypothetical protein